MHATRLLALSGSLRAGSTNTALLRAMASLAPEEVRISMYEGLAGLPPFNPDLLGAEPPDVREFRAAIGAADGVLISSPEYGHGVPGTLKNALDWLFTGEEFMGKPVAIINASPLSTHADASLRETVAVMMGRIIPGASVTVALPGRNLDAREMAAHPELSAALRAALGTFVRAIRNPLP